MIYIDNKIKLNSFVFCFASFLVSLASIAQPSLLKRIFDNYKHIEIMKTSILFYGVTIILIISFEYLAKLSLVKISVGIKENIRKSIADTIQKDEYTEINKQNQAEINVDINRNIDVFIEEYYINKLNIIMLTISLVFYGVTTSKLDNLMVLIIFIPNIITLLIPTIFRKKVSKRRNDLIEKNENYNLGIFDFYSGINILKNFFATSFWRTRLDQESTKSIVSEKKFGILKSLIECMVGFISFVGVLLLLTYGVHKVGIGYMTIGTLAASFQFSELITLPMMNLTMSLNTLTSGKEVMKRLNLRYKSSPNITNWYPKKIKEEFEKFEYITFDNFSFSYNTDSVINIESCTLNRGDKILITGDNGCGKSTLMRLITKEVEGYNGKIIINGEELKNIPLKNINNIFSFLRQNDYMFQTNVENNIKLYSDINISDFPEILSLTKYCEIPKNDITSQSISGGEIQRISFIRALVRDKDVLIIDESLNEIQKDIRNNIINWLSMDKNLTLFYISHDYKDINKFFNVNINFENKKIHINRR